MVAKLTVIFFIVLCLLLGTYLILLPWMSFNLIGDWGDNFLLAFVSEKANLPVLRKTVASGWVRGAVTGLGILNLLLAFWEMANFKQSVRMLEGRENIKNSQSKAQSEDSEKF